MTRRATFMRATVYLTGDGADPEILEETLEVIIGLCDQDAAKRKFKFGPDELEAHPDEANDWGAYTAWMAGKRRGVKQTFEEFRKRFLGLEYEEPGEMPAPASSPPQL